jgi:hypothetical protein
LPVSSARRRGLADVFHYFIPEEEQRSARDRGPSSAWGNRWALVIDPDRPLDRSLALDLAWALRAQTGELEVVAPFAPPSSWGAETARAWRVLPHATAEAIQPSDAPLLVVVAPEGACALVRESAGSLNAALLPVEAAPWGVPEALARIRRLALREGSIRIGALLVRDERSKEDVTPLRQLERAAERQLGVQVELLGTVVRDRSSYRALLVETPVLKIDPGAPSSESLRALAQRMFPDTAPRLEAAR